MRKVLLGLLLIVMPAIGYFVWQSWKPADDAARGVIDSRPGTAAVAVEVAPVEQRGIRDMRRFTGTLLAAAQFEVAPRIAGKLVHLGVDIGDEVRKGQVVARLDDDEYQQQMEEARAAVEVARATLAEARGTLNARQKELNRTRQLREQKIASQAELDSVEAEAIAQQARVSLAEAQVRQAEAALRAAQVRLSYTTISADWENGDESRVVGERFVDEGTTVSANTPVITVLDIRELTGVVHVTERDYPRLRVGQTVEIVADAYPTQTFDGTIRRLAPQFREASRQARVEIRIPNPQRLLKPGMFINARIELERKADATIVPYDALVEREGRQGVFTVDRDTGKASFVAVEVGIIERDKAEVTSPQLGGEVITLGQHLLEDGSRIVIPDMRNQQRQRGRL